MAKDPYKINIHEFHQLLRESLSSISNEMSLIYDNEQENEESMNRWVHTLIYKVKGRSIKIKQYDWRDYHEHFIIYLNDAEMHDVDISLFDTNKEAVNDILIKVKKLVY